MRIRWAIWVLLGAVGCGSTPRPAASDAPAAGSEREGDPSELLEEGRRLLRSGRSAGAQRAFENAASSAASRQDTALLAEALAESAAGRARAGQLEEAEKLLQAGEARALPEDARAWARVRAARGLLLHLSGDSAGAAWAYGEAFTSAERSGQIGLALECAHRLALWSPEVEREEWAREGISLAQAYEEARWEALLQADLALAMESTGDTAGALQAQLRSRLLHYATGGDLERLRADWAVGRSYRIDGRPQAALEWMTNVLGRAELRMEALGDRESRLWTALANGELARVEQALGHSDQAELYATRAEDLLRPVGAGGLLSLDPRNWLSGIASLADGF